MPKQTFFNLDGAKQGKLVKALMKEFSRASLHEASISNIVKFAEIPRGSFYQYFEDKEDAFLYLMNAYGQENKKRFAAKLIETDGDLFATFAYIYRWILKDLANGDKSQFFKNAFLNMNYKMERTLSNYVETNDLENSLPFITAWRLQHNLAISTKKELVHVFAILVSVTMHNIIHAFATQLPVEKACDNYQIELNMLKKGLLKNK
ncbi:transcriptional regulator, TetR family [Amphibacillus marinus]|uniref:Transcriptional regulator, TetR family n=1 Tax=Amphibacillus marinus TaxID=872970 RepID=A0A1H8L6C7_9BACI|nr:TetR/AcrR family transcriptional regulator [Amphibacillus marinus]SEO00704.1 transcriptional regulator, TetR family [Amphibacillus marinus]